VRIISKGGPEPQEGGQGAKILVYGPRYRGGPPAARLEIETHYEAVKGNKLGYYGKGGRVQRLCCGTRYRGGPTGC